MNYDVLAFLANTIVSGMILGGLASVVFWVVARTRNVPVTQVQFLYGPGAVEFKLFGTIVKVGSIPAGSSVDFDPVVFRAQPLAWRLFALISGPLVLLLLASAFLGPAESVMHFLHGLLELPKGALHPKSAAQHLISQYRQLYDTSLLQALGVLSTKIAASVMLPLMGSASAQIIRQFFADDENKILRGIFLGHNINMMLLAFFWGYAMTFYYISVK